MHSFLKKEKPSRAVMENFYLKKPRAAVRVMVDHIEKELVCRITEESIIVASVSMCFVLLDKKIRVVDGDSKTCLPTGEFYISAETFDPYHLLVDVF